MGRLFWKFFFFLMLAQVVTIVGVSSAIWLRHRNLTMEASGPGHVPPGVMDERERPPPPPQDHPERRRAGGPGRSSPSLFPVEPIIGGVIVSFAVAALLAWYVSKPIRFLRRAFDTAAQGDLDARIGNGLGRRRDELADLGRDFDRTAAKLKGLMDGQRRLLHDVSHELRSPLARLQAAIGLARQYPDNLDATMDRIEREAERMDKLVDEILTLSRVESGMSALPDESVDLALLVNDVVEDAAFEAQARSLSVAIDTDLQPTTEVIVTGNPEMLHRALENIVRNAVRHTPSGGRVRVSSAFAAAGRTIELTVTDDGPGVEPAELASIFDPFFRGSGAKATQGHGLGLAIARRVVEAHGGTVAASNRPSGGLAVTIRLPSA